MKYVVIALFLGNFIFVAATNLLTPLFALFVAQVSPMNSAATAGMLWGTFVAATVIFLSIVSCSKWFNQRHDVDMMMVGMILRIAGWSMYIASPSLVSMFCAQLILGAGEASGSPAFNALMANTSLKSKIVPRKFFGMWQFTASIAMALAAVIGGHVVKTAGFKALFICMIALAGGAVVATAIFRRQLLAVKEENNRNPAIATDSELFCIS